VNTSNFFDAIQFVLVAPKFYNLRQEDRQQLLHEGYYFFRTLPVFCDFLFVSLVLFRRAGSSVMAAYVEIVFDNSDCKSYLLCYIFLGFSSCFFFS
jgi:structural maintenance of chromosome 3 (chondroitin sulfate proteoglycan 6)